VKAVFGSPTPAGAGSEREAIMPGLMWPHLRHPREVEDMAEAQAKRWAQKQKEGSEAVAGTLPVAPIPHKAGEQGLVPGRSVAQRLGSSRHQ